MIQTFSHIFQKEGPKTLWSGLVPVLSSNHTYILHNILIILSLTHQSLWRCVPGVALYFTSLEVMKSIILPDHKKSLDPMQALAAGASARCIAGIVLMPFTVIKTRFEVISMSDQTPASWILPNSNQVEWSVQVQDRNGSVLFYISPGRRARPYDGPWSNTSEGYSIFCCLLRSLYSAQATSSIGSRLTLSVHPLHSRETFPLVVIVCLWKFRFNSRPWARVLAVDLQQASLPPWLLIQRTSSRRPCSFPRHAISTAHGKPSFPFTGGWELKASFLVCCLV